VIVNVLVRDDASALKALRTFALKLLDDHPGVVKDSYTNEVWTREEIATNAVRSGRRFLAGGDPSSEGPDTA